MNFYYFNDAGKITNDVAAEMAIDILQELSARAINKHFRLYFAFFSYFWLKSPKNQKGEIWTTSSF